MRRVSPLLSRLRPLADILLRTRKNGCTTADLIEYAQECGVLKGTETARQLSGLGHAFREAGGIHFGETRVSHLEGQKSVRQTVWYPRHKSKPPVLERAKKDGR